MLRSVAVAVVLLFGSLANAQAQSGIAVGDSVRAFNPQHVTGPDAGKSACLVCANGEKPVIAIFAREVDDGLTNLIRQVEEATRKNKKANLAAFTIFLDKSEETEERVKKLGDTLELRETVLALDNPAGPKGYNLAKDANVTVLLYVNRKVRAKYAFEKGKMTNADIEKILRDLPKILSE
jgi:hypothetical protein